MSKKAQRFEQSSGWSARPGGGVKKRPSRTPGRVDVSEGSRRMADGGLSKHSNLTRKDQLLAQFRAEQANGKLSKQIRCPICKQPVKVSNFERHIRRVH